MKTTIATLSSGPMTGKTTCLIAMAKGWLPEHGEVLWIEPTHDFAHDLFKRNFGLSFQATIVSANNPELLVYIERAGLIIVGNAARIEAETLNRIRTTATQKHQAQPRMMFEEHS